MYGVSGYLSEMALDLRRRSIISAPAAKRRPPRQNAPMIMPMLAAVDKLDFGQSEDEAAVTAVAAPVAPADWVMVILIVDAIVATGMVDVMSGTLVVESVIETPKSLHAAIMYENTAWKGKSASQREQKGRLSLTNLIGGITCRRNISL